MVLDHFSTVTRRWFEGAFAEPTAAQAGAWASIARGDNTLVVAPTGSGKTLAAFLWSLDRLATAPEVADPARRCRVVYVSPLKALAVDVERNLRAPLTGLKQTARRLGLPVPDISVAVRSGDTPAEDRRRFAAKPADILITTPESLFLILTSQAREALRGVETVIVDEVHAVAATKRGAHLALTLERLDALLERPAQRIGLSATVRPVGEVATFLGGTRPAVVVQPPHEKRMEIEVVVPVEDMAEPPPPPPDPDGVPMSSYGMPPTERGRGIWPHVEEHLLDLIESHRSTIVFANSRRLAERLCTRLNELSYDRRLASGTDRPGDTDKPGDTDPGAPKAHDRRPGDVRLDDIGPGERQAHDSRSGDAGPDDTAPDGPQTHDSRSGDAGPDDTAPGIRPSGAGPNGAGPGSVGPGGAGPGGVGPGGAAAGTEPGAAGVGGPAARVSPAEMMAQAGVGRGLPAEPGQGGEVVRAHHGSVSKQERAHIEEALKSGRLPAVVATSSLELGIDMGAVDLVACVEAPPSVASGLQRIGRAGHQVGAVSKGVIFPKYRGDLIQTAVVAERMKNGEIEELRYPRNPLDVLAQQIVAMTAMDEWTVDELEAVVRRAAPYATLPRSALEATLDMLAGRYPSEEFAELRPRIVWDRVTGTLRGRPGAQRLAVTSGGTIPDRGLFGVFLAGGDKAARVGELDEEMVYESRAGDVFVLGATSWRIEDIGPDRVLVSPAPGQPGKLPFWHGDTPGRPVELGRAIGAFLRELSGAKAEQAAARARAAGLDDFAVCNLLAYLAEQREATGYVPDDRTLLIERFHDELGDWRVVVHSPYGARVHAPWALAIGRRLRERYGVDVQAVHSDDGIVLRVPDTLDNPPGDVAVFDPDEIEQIVTEELGGSALFAARFRECAGRALLLPRRNPGRRTPLWQQRQRAAHLLGVASRYGSFPVVLETMRECLQDVFDVPGLVQLMRDVAARRVRVVEVETSQASPFAASLLFRYIGAFMYEGDAPLAERRAQALALDTGLLAELLGQADLRELLDPDVIAETERELARLDRPLRDAEDLADLLRSHGPLLAEDVTVREGDPAWLTELESARRAIRVRVAGVEQWAAIEDAARLRDALGVPPPVGVPHAFLEPVPDPLGDLVARHARTRGPFAAATASSRFGLGVAVVTDALRRLAASGRVVAGEFRPGGRGEEWCDAGVLRLLRRRSLARLRREVEPVAPEVLAAFAPAWHGIPASGRGPRGMDALVGAIEQLQGAAVPASALETLVLPARVPGYQPAMLDELTASGEVIWAGQGSLPGGDGWVSLYFADTAPLLLPEPAEITMTPLHEQVLDVLSGGGALFFRDLSSRVGSLDDSALVAALWDLVWSGRVSGDTLAPLRAALGTGRPAHRPPAGRRRRAVLPTRSGPPTVAGRWWALPSPSPDATQRAHAQAETLLERHGVLTRGAVTAERLPGGFAAVYQVLRAFEESGRCRRGYFVEGLGGAQFALPGAVDRMRAMAPSTPTTPPTDGPRPGPQSDTPTPSATGDTPPHNAAPWIPASPHGSAVSPSASLGAFSGRGRESRPRAVVLAAADPANPYGAALPWPERHDDHAHKPGRKAGALVVLIDGRLVLYVERGGKSLLSFGDEDLQPAVDALALAVRDGALGKLTVERADGTPINDSPLAAALEAAGFHPTPRGLRLRA